MTKRRNPNLVLMIKELSLMEILEKENERIKAGIKKSKKKK